MPFSLHTAPVTFTKKCFNVPYYHFVNILYTIKWIDLDCFLFVCETFSLMTFFPSIFTGTAIRHCSEEKGWLSPELFNCTTVTFSHLKKLVRAKWKNNMYTATKARNILQSNDILLNYNVAWASPTLSSIYFFEKTENVNTSKPILNSSPVTSSKEIMSGFCCTCNGATLDWSFL